MDYTLSLTRHDAETLQAHLLGDRTHEQMAITLCGVNRMHRELRLLVRDVILLPADAFRRQSAAGLELKPEVQAFIHERAHERGLVQVDWHSHPGRGPGLAFSATDDHYESAQAVYLAHRMNGTPYGSVVVNDDALDARLWINQVTRTGAGEQVETFYRPIAYRVRAIIVGDLQRRTPLGAQRDILDSMTAPSSVYDRQVRAFGQTFQHKMGSLRVGVVGVGGLGSAMVDLLARLGVRDWVLVDPDAVELTNLNRLVNATLTDAQKARPKVNVARSTIRQSNPNAHVQALCADVFAPKVQRALKSCDLLIAATDNHSSRMALNRLAVQYLIPVVHVGFNISVGDAREVERVVTDISGEFAIPDLGRWCLQCAGIVDPQQAGWELAPDTQRAILRERGYVTDTPAPAVRHLDSLVGSLASAEIHNLVHRFKPLERYLTCDVLGSKLTSLQVTPSHTCPVCSADYGVLGLGDLELLPDYRRTGQVTLPPAPAPKSAEAGANGKALQLAAPSVPTPQPPEERRTLVPPLDPNKDTPD